MLTNQDITKLQAHFVTKTEFKAFEQKVECRFEKVETRLDQVEVRLDRVEAKLDEITTMLANIMGEIQTMRQEITLIVYRQARHSDALEKLGFAD